MGDEKSKVACENNRARDTVVHTDLEVYYGVDHAKGMTINFTEALIAEVGKIRNGIPTGTLATQEEFGKVIANVALGMCKIAIEQTLIPALPAREAKELPYSNDITEKCRSEQLGRAAAFFGGTAWRM